MTKVDEPGDTPRIKSLRDPKIKAGVITSNFSSSTLTFTRGNFARISGLAGFDRGTKTFGPADVRAIKLAMLAEKNHFELAAPPPPRRDGSPKCERRNRKNHRGRQCRHGTGINGV